MTFFGRPAFTVRSPHRPQPITPRGMTRATAPITMRRRATMCAARVARYRLFFETPSLAFVWASFRGPNGRSDCLCTWLSCPPAIDAPPRRRGGCREPAVVHRWLPAQAPAYYYYTATDDSTYGYDDSAYAYGSDDAYGHAQCLNQMVAARCATAESRPPRHRRDASSMAWRRGLSPLDSACATAFSPRKDLVKNYRAQPTHRFARRLCGG